MSQVSKNVKLLYCAGEKLNVETLRNFVSELEGVEFDDTLDVQIEKNGNAFTIEGFIGGV